MDILRSPVSPLIPITDNQSLQDLYFDLLRRLKPKVCCDIGANNGDAALRAKSGAPAARIYAFEANPEIHARHRSRLSAEGVDYINLAINDKDGEIIVYAPRTLSKAWADGRVIDASVVETPETGKTSLLLRNETATYAEFSVPSQRLDEFFRDKLGNTRFALWIDVEGAASAVIAGAKEVLKSTEIVFVEVEGFSFWKDQMTAGSVVELLRERGFVPVARDRAYGDYQFNMLFLRAEQKELINDFRASAISYPRCDLPVFIPSFNNPTHLRGMVQQLLRIGLHNITVVDNGSTFPPLLDYLDSIAKTCSVLRQTENHGPRHFFRDAVFYDQLPQYFCITDPDLELNPNLPADFVNHLMQLMERHRIGKAGFALDISEPQRMRADLFEIGDRRYRIWEWEDQFWQTPLESEGEDIPYRALLATTFAVYNKAFFNPEQFLEGIRVAGRYTARHLPWYNDERLPDEEAAFYRATSRYSYYCGEPPQY